MLHSISFGKNLHPLHFLVFMVTQEMKLWRNTSISCFWSSYSKQARFLWFNLTQTFILIDRTNWNDDYRHKNIGYTIYKTENDKDLE